MFLIGETLWFYCSKSTVLKEIALPYNSEIDGGLCSVSERGDVIHW